MNLVILIVTLTFGSVLPAPQYGGTLAPIRNPTLGSVSVPATSGAAPSLVGHPAAGSGSGFAASAPVRHPVPGSVSAPTNSAPGPVTRPATSLECRVEYTTIWDTEYIETVE